MSKVKSNPDHDPAAGQDPAGQPPAPATADHVRPAHHAGGGSHPGAGGAQPGAADAVDQGPAPESVGSDFSGDTPRTVTVYEEGRVITFRMESSDDIHAYEQGLLQRFDQGAAQARAGIVKRDLSEIAAGFAQMFTVVKVEHTLVETGDRTHPPEEGLTECSRIMAKTKREHPGEMFNTKLIPAKTEARCDRVDGLIALRGPVQALLDPLLDTLAGEQRELGTEMRGDYLVVKPVLPANRPLREALAKVTKWVAGPALAGADQAKKNSKLVDDTEKRMMDWLASTGKPVTPQGTPAPTGTGTPPPPPHGVVVPAVPAVPPHGTGRGHKKGG